MGKTAGKSQNRKELINMEVELKPCPFCGAQAAAIWGVELYRAVCPKCGSKTDCHDTQQQAADVWNRRA